MSIGRDGIAGLVLLAICLVLLVKSFQLPSLPIVPVGPGFYPSIVLSFMAAASALLVLQDLLKRRAPAVASAGAAPRRNYRLVVIAFAIVGAYVVLLPLLGFRVATVLFVGATGRIGPAENGAAMGGARRDRARHRRGELFHL